MNPEKKNASAFKKNAVAQTSFSAGNDIILKGMPVCDRKITGLTGLICLALLISGCWTSEAEGPDAYLLRVGDSVLTVAEFNRSFELSKAAYPHNVLQDPAVLNTIRSRLLSQTTEEMILLEKAKEIGVEVTDEELEAAVSDIKKDYPGGVFEETLMEYAVPYPLWKERLKIRLIKEKVVAKELLERVTITADDISNYIADQLGGNEDARSFAEGSQDLNEVIVQRLRRQKAEEAYRTWIKKLQESYPIEINKLQWEKITGSWTDGIKTR
jgi:hypothetical protein